MAKAIKLMAKTRALSGSANARRMRRDGVLPGVVYYRSKPTGMIQMEQHAFERMLHHHASENLIVDLAVDDGDVSKVLMKEVQHDALTGHVLHVDFAEVSMTEKMHVKIRVDLIGECKGVTAGGILEHPMREIEVECLPGDLVEQFTLDVTELQIGDRLTAGDVKLPEVFTLVTPREHVVATVALPRLEEEPKPAEAGEGAAEPEVIGAKKEEGEEGEEAAKGGKEAKGGEEAPEKKKKKE
jgi:large subunit ribosomal protein L25